MVFTEAKINKLLNKIWEDASKRYPSPKNGVVCIGKGFFGGKRGKYYKEINDEFVRVYKKYGYKPKENN